ncbi:MAG: HAD hydrolase-like protein [Candidatus Micrarchaeota archaeon]|nr:HAD hydrolase-like protein [Candidatus Micrarchaeota archaeon]
MKPPLYFDLDDTLFPSTDFTREARDNAVKAMIAQGAPYSFEELRLALDRIVEEKTSNYPYHFDLLAKQFNLTPLERYVAAAVAAYHATKFHMTPYPEVHYVLTELKMRGYPLYVVTQGLPKKQWEKIIRLRLEWLFENNVIVTDQKTPEFFKSLEKGVMIGDNPESDIAPAREAGHYTIRIRRGKRAHLPSNAHREITDLRELLTLYK